MGMFELEKNKTMQRLMATEDTKANLVSHLKQYYGSGVVPYPKAGAQLNIATTDEADEVTWYFHVPSSSTLIRVENDTSPNPKLGIGLKVPPSLQSLGVFLGFDKVPDDQLYVDYEELVLWIPEPKDGIDFLVRYQKESWEDQFRRKHGKP